MELKFGQMVLSIREGILKVRNKERENLCEQMEVILRESLKIIIYMAKEYIFGMMEGNMKVNGKIIKWMGLIKIIFYWLS